MKESLPSRSSHPAFETSAGRSRRQFIGHAGLWAAGAGMLGLSNRNGRADDEPVDCAPVPIPPSKAVPYTPDPSAPLRQRKSAWNLSTTELNNLRAAYQALRNLPTTDPRSWIRQANVHCWYCGGGQDGVAGEEIHGSWWFFAWHRCYLYFHERILGKLINVPTLALPYWDWDNTAHRTVPPPYSQPGATSNSLWDQQRGAGPTDTMPSSIFANLNTIMNTSNTSVFMGRNVPDASNGGAIENGVHGAVHIWTGDPSMKTAAQDMGVLATAAQDPVFFTHHCNIDRLWDVWINSSTKHQNPSSSSWLTHRWNFYDENSQWTSIAVADIISPQKLGYTYQPLSMASPLATFAITQDSAKIALGSAPVSKTTAVPDQLRKTVSEPATAAAAKPGRSFVLHIEGIEAPLGTAALVRVFVNRTNATAKTALEAPNYVGYFSLFPETLKPKTRNQERPHSKHVVFDISPHIAKLIETNKQISVTLVPTTAKDEQPEDKKITFQKVYLTVEE